MNTRKNKYELILFDVDGTLLDTKEGIISTYKEALMDFGVTFPPGFDENSLIGPPIPQGVQEKFGLPNEVGVQIAAKFVEIYKSGNIYKAVKYDGIDEILAYLKNKGYKLGVATNKRFDVASDILEHFGIRDYFDAIEGADFARKSFKPNMIRNHIKNFNIKNTKILLVGDSNSDAVAALETGIDYIEADYGFGFSKDHQYEGKKVGAIACPIELKKYL